MRSVFATLFIGLILVISCTPKQDGITITEKEYGDKWPFTVKEGVLECRNGSEVVFTAEGKTYALNGTAVGTKKYEAIEAIWKDDPAFPGMKIGIGDLIRRGLDLGDKK